MRATEALRDRAASLRQRTAPAREPGVRLDLRSRLPGRPGGVRANENLSRRAVPAGRAPATFEPLAAGKPHRGGAESGRVESQHARARRPEPWPARTER